MVEFVQQGGVPAAANAGDGDSSYPSRQWAGLAGWKIRGLLTVLMFLVVYFFPALIAESRSLEKLNPSITIKQPSRQGGGKVPSVTIAASSFNSTSHPLPSRLVGGAYQKQQNELESEEKHDDVVVGPSSYNTSPTAAPGPVINDGSDDHQQEKNISSISTLQVLGTKSSS